MAIVLVHLRRIVLMFSLVFVSEMLWEHAMYMVHNQSAFKTAAQLLEPRTGRPAGHGVDGRRRWHLQAWMLLYIVYAYTIVCAYPVMPAVVADAFNNR